MSRTLYASGCLIVPYQQSISDKKECLRIQANLSQAEINGKRLNDPLPCLFFNEQAEKLAIECREGERIALAGRVLKTSFLVGKCDTRKEGHVLWVYRFEKI